MSPETGDRIRPPQLAPKGWIEVRGDAGDTSFRRVQAQASREVLTVCAEGVVTSQSITVRYDFYRPLLPLLLLSSAV